MKVIVGHKSEFIMLGMDHLKDDTSLFKTTQTLNVTCVLIMSMAFIPVMFMTWKPLMFAAETIPIDGDSK